MFASEKEIRDIETFAQCLLSFMIFILWHVSCLQFAHLDRDHVFCRRLVRVVGPYPYLCHDLYLCPSGSCK